MFTKAGSTIGITRGELFYFGILNEDTDWPEDIDGVQTVAAYGEGYFYDVEGDYPLSVVSWHVENFPGTIAFEEKQNIFYPTDLDFETETETFELFVTI